jgi:hypothetical protein
MIATPCYGKMLGEGYLHSVMATVDLLRSHGHRVKVRTVGNESLITRARNNMVAHFLSTDFDKMMFIDADITWPAKAALELLESGHEVCGIPYPTKTFDWERVAAAANGRQEGDANLKPQELRQRALRFTINRSKGSPPPANGWLEVDALGTGFFMMDRPVLERMRDHYREELAYKNDIKGYFKLAPPEHCVALFENMIEPESRRYLSEDYAFCKRWRDLGGKIHCCTKYRLIHSGTADF